MGLQTDLEVSTINITRILMEFIRSAVTGAELSDLAKNVDENVMRDVFGLAQKHDLAQMIADVLLKNETSANEELLAVCRQVSLVTLIRYQQQTYEFNRICNLFEENSVPFIPLKGAVIRDYYPEPHIRTSCDIDILVHPENVESISKLLVENYRYKQVKKTPHDVIFASEGGVYLELHFNLIDDDVKKNGEYLRKWNAECLKNVWNNTHLACGTKYQYRLNDEVMYFYHIAHMAKHFETGGCGIKPFVDLWLINNKLEFDEEKRKALLQAGNLLGFAENVKRLSEVWLDGKDSDEITDTIEDYVITGGVYGNIKNKVIYNQSKAGSRFKYAMSRIFVSYDILKLYFPIVTRHRWLMPFCQVGRWLKIIFRKRLKNSINELNINNKINDDVKENMEELIKILGL